MPQTLPSAEPFLLPGSGRNARNGVLLVHGFTSTPKEMHELGVYLNERGFTVLGIRLAGHATRLDDLARLHGRDWLLSIEDGYNLLRASTDRVFLVGLSLGGSLALVFSTLAEVHGVAALCTPYNPAGDWHLLLATLLSPLIRYLPKMRGGRWYGDGWKTHLAYPSYPSRAISGVRRVQRLLHRSLPRVKVPVLLVNSRNDHPGMCASMDRLFSALQTQDKRRLWIEGSGHTITEEPPRFQVFQVVAEFMLSLVPMGNVKSI